MAVALAGAAMIATSAEAVPITFNFTSSEYEASFLIDSTISPDFFSPGELFFYELPVTSGGTTTKQLVTFISSSFPVDNGNGVRGGGFSSDGTFERFFYGPQVYGGTEANPTFATGIFNLTGYNSGAPGVLSVVVGPGAPAPEVGMGLLSALAAGLALFLSRMRMPLLPFASRRRFAAA
jgi:hypothetical protein